MIGEYFDEKRAIANSKRRRKYPSKYGWLTLAEIREKTGISEYQFYMLFRDKTVDQILEKHERASGGE